MNTFGPAGGGTDGGGLFGLSQRLPPANLEAEQALLGALLANNKAYERVSEFLAAEHFVDAVHGRIYAAIQRRVEAGQLADAVTLRVEFEHNGLLDEVGGPAYLGQLLSAMVGIINAGEYGRVIHDAWLRRQLIDVGETVVNRAFGAEPELDARQQLEAAEQNLFDLSRDKGGGENLVTFERALSQAVQQAAKAFSGPPQITESAPASAPLVPPETGASSSMMPLAESSSPSARSAVTSTVLMQITICPGAAPAAKPLITDSACAVVSTMQMECAHCRAMASGAWATSAPASDSACTLRASISCTTRPKPAFSRLRAIGSPIAPSPTKPIFSAMIKSPRSHQW